MNSGIQSIHIFEHDYLKIINHATRKLDGHYSDGETKETKAYGVIGGQINHDIAYIKEVIELRRNYRSNPEISKQMNKLIEDVAIPTRTPTEERAWVAVPEEVLPITENFDKIGLDIIGTYHMHHELKDIPTELDRQLGKDSDMVIFIVHIDENHQGSIRAFYEAVNEIDLQII